MRRATKDRATLASSTIRQSHEQTTGKSHEFYPYLRLFEAMLLNAKDNVKRFRGKRSFAARQFHREAWEYIREYGPATVRAQELYDRLSGRESGSINVVKLIRDLAAQEPIDSPYRNVV